MLIYHCTVKNWLHVQIKLFIYHNASTSYKFSGKLMTRKQKTPNSNIYTSLWFMHPMSTEVEVQPLGGGKAQGGIHNVHYCIHSREVLSSS